MPTDYGSLVVDNGSGKIGTKQISIIGANLFSNKLDNCSLRNAHNKPCCWKIRHNADSHHSLMLADLNRTSFATAWRYFASWLKLLRRFDTFVPDGEVALVAAPDPAISCFLIRRFQRVSDDDDQIPGSFDNMRMHGAVKFAVICRADRL